MGATTLERRELKTASRARERARQKAGNKIANAIKLAPLSVKREWSEVLKDDAFYGFRNLLVGAGHRCPSCGYNAGPHTTSGKAYACGCDRPHPAAVRAYLELTGDLGPANTVMVNFVQQLGVKDENELSTLVGEGRRFRELGADKSDDEYREAAMSMLKALHRKRPEWREADALQLSGVSHAVEATNGTEPHA